MITVLLPVLAYLIGSLSSAVLVARLFGLADPRTVGSRNPGATNILRYGGRIPAALTLAGDVLKGVIPVVLARLLGVDALTLGLVMLAAFLGHLYPVYFGFQGGKGVATAFGVYFAVDPRVGLMIAATWLLVAALTRYSSLSALVATLAAPVFWWWLRPEPELLAAMIALAVLIVWRHRANIARLRAGTETRIGR